MEIKKYLLKDMVKLRTVDERRAYYDKFAEYAKKDELARIPINLTALCKSEMLQYRDDEIREKKKVIDYYELRKKIRHIEVEYSYEYAYGREQEIIDDIVVVSELNAQLRRKTYDDDHLEQYETRLNSVISDATYEHDLLVKLVDQMLREQGGDFDLETYRLSVQKGYDHFLALLQPIEEIVLPVERGDEQYDDRLQHSDDLVEAEAEKQDIIGWLDNTVQHTMVISDAESHIKVGKGLKTPLMVWALPETIPEGHNVISVHGVPEFVTVRHRYIYTQGDWGEVMVGKLGDEDMDDGYYMLSTTLQLLDVYIHHGEDYRNRKYSDRQILCSQLKEQYPHLMGVPQRTRTFLWISPGKVDIMYRTCGVVSSFSLYEKVESYYRIIRRVQEGQCYMIVFGGGMRMIFKICKKQLDIPGFLVMLGQKILWHRDKCLFRVALERKGYECSEIRALLDG